MNNDKNKDLENKLDLFLNQPDCNGDECKIYEPKELVEKINKKIVTEDGRQLLI
jgi:hypothetical protein